jgi:hypothetical protein
MTTQGFADATDVDVDDVRSRRRGGADPRGELFARDDLARSLDEAREDVELAQREGHATPVDEELTAGQIEQERPPPEVPGARRRATHESVGASAELFDVERNADALIGAGPKRARAELRLGRAGDHEDGDPELSFIEPTTKLDVALPPGEPRDDDEIGARTASERLRLVSRALHRAGESRENVEKEGELPTLVLQHENAHLAARVFKT